VQHGVGDPEPDADRQERQVDQRHDFNLWVRRPAWCSIVGYGVSGDRNPGEHFVAV
jgi:hypothetical protein